MSIEIDGVNNIIKANTISEVTSANGVAVDGVTLKDGQIDLADSKKILLGTGDDLQLYHDGSHSYIQDEGTGDLKITTNGAAISLQKGTSETLAYFATDSGFNLYHDNVERIGTTAAATVFNETGVDIDFRVESNDNSGMFFVNAGANHVSVGTDGDLGGVFNVSGETVMRTTGNSDTLTLKCTDADAALGPVLRLFRSSSSPADDDILGSIFFTGEDSGGNDTNYALIRAEIMQESDGSEDSQLEFFVQKSGTQRSVLKLDRTETCFNIDSQDIDFRVESNNNTHMIFVDGGNDHVNIGGSSDLGGMLNVAGNGVFQNTDQTDTLSLLNTDADANVGPRLKFGRNSASPAVNDLTGDIRFEGKDDGGNDFVTAQIRTQMTGVTNGSEEGKFWIETMVAGTARQRMSIAGAETIFNEDSVDVDFRVESNDNTHMFFVDAGNNHVTMGTGSGGDLGGVLNIQDNSQTGIFAENGGGSTQSMILRNTAGSFNSRISTLQSTRNSSGSFEFSRFLSNDGNDVEHLFEGSGDIKIDGSVTTGGIDYAEYFEWKDGNSSSEDRRGHSVITDGNKIVVATSSDDASKIIGIVSTNPTILGDADLEKWMFKYERDDYGSLIWEEHTVTEWTDEDGKDHSYDTDRIPSDVTAPSDATVISEEEDKYGNTIKLKRKKLNSEWDSTQDYVSRKDRKEWEAIGLVGKLRLKKGEPTNPNWIKLRDISDTVEEWLVR